MATRRAETISSSATVVSNLTGVGSGVVFASRKQDGSWEVALEDRDGTSRHVPLDAELLTALEEVHLDLEPTLLVSADGRSVTGVRGLDQVYEATHTDLETLAKAYNKEVESLWVTELPQLLGATALEAEWRAMWADGWGATYGRTWIVDEPVEWEATTGETITLTYSDVVPCKFNEDEPLCVRIDVAYPEGESAAPDARFRAQLPAGAESAAVATTHTVRRTGELVVEAGTGLPWQWSSIEQETHGYNHKGTEHTLLVRRKEDVSCDWRVAE